MNPRAARIHACLMFSSVEHRLRAAVASASASTSSCVPDGAVLLSYVNAYHAALHQEALAPVKVAMPCLMARFVVLCANVSGAVYRPGHPVALPASRASDYLSADFHSITHLKWQALDVALLVTDSVLWLDADVLLLRSPFQELRSAPPAGFRFQSSREPCPTHELACSSRCRVVNTGQMWISDRVFVQRVLARLTNSSADHWEQVAAREVVEGGIQGACSLSSHYASYCWFHARPPFPPPAEVLCELVSFHSACAVGLAKKVKLLRTVRHEHAVQCGTAVDSVHDAIFQRAAGENKSQKPFAL